jgi:hypothetical protein
MLNDYERNDAYYKALRNQVILFFILFFIYTSPIKALRNQVIFYFLFFYFFYTSSMTPGTRP